MSDHHDEVIAHSKQQKRSGIIIVISLVFIIFIGAFCYGYFQLAQVNMRLAGMVANVQEQSKATQQQVLSMQNHINLLQQAVDKPKNAASEMQADQTVIEAQYLVKLAYDQAQFMNNYTAAQSLLQRAAQVLAPEQNSNLLEVRKAIEADIVSLQAASLVDVADIYIHLTALNAKVEQLPMPATPLQAEANTAPANLDGLPWWKAGLEKSWQALRQIVIIRNTGEKNLSVVALPEEKVFLYQNLHAQLESAMWGALHRNAGVYKESLARTIVWVQQYFAQDAAETRTMLQNLQELQKLDVQAPTLNLSNTLQLFATQAKTTG